MTYTHIKIVPISTVLADIVHEGAPYQQAIDEQTALAEAAPKLLRHLEALCFLAETVAHLRGLESDILPLTDSARELIASVKPDLRYAFVAKRSVELQQCNLSRAEAVAQAKTEYDSRPA